MEKNKFNENLTNVINSVVAYINKIKTMKNPKFYYVYVITNNINHKQYVGSRICHISPDKDTYMGSSKSLKEDYKIYGIENFSKMIISDNYINSKEMLDEESFYILKYNTLYPSGYNRFIPNKKEGFYMENYHYSEESREKMRQSKLGRPSNNRGKKFSEESKKLVSLSQMGEKNHGFGKPLSEEHKASIGKSLKGKTPWNKGKKFKI